MKSFKIWCFVLFVGLFSSISQGVKVIENALGVIGHKSGIYIHQNNKPTDVNVMGVESMFQEVDEKTAIYAVFEYENNNSSAFIAKQMLESALKLKLPNESWKTFLETEMVKIEARLMRNNIPEAEAESSTRALVVIVDGSTVTAAQVGLSKMVVYVKDSIDSNKFDLKSMADYLDRDQMLYVLGGKKEKGLNSHIHGDAVVTQLNDVKFIVMGTISMWRYNDYETAESILKNEKDYKKAAKEIANIKNAPSAKKYDYGVIVVALQKGTNFGSILKSLCCMKF